jgi:hypothetical protein
MNLLCREPRQIFEAHVLEPKASARLQRLNLSAYPRIHQQNSSDSLIANDLNLGKRLVDLAQLEGFPRPPSGYLWDSSGPL